MTHRTKAIVGAICLVSSIALFLLILVLKAEDPAMDRLRRIGFDLGPFPPVRATPTWLRPLEVLVGPLNRFNSYSSAEGSVSESDLALLRSLDHELEILIVDVPHLSAARFEHVARLQRLTDLKMHARASDRGCLSELPRLRNLMTLELKCPTLEDSDFTVLANMSSLRRLNLYATQTTDAVLVALAKLPDLESVALYRTQATPAGAAAFMKERPSVIVSIK